MSRGRVCLFVLEFLYFWFWTYFQSVCWLFPCDLSKSVWSSLVTFARSLCIISLCLAFSICRVDSRLLVPADLSVLLFFSSSVRSFRKVEFVEGSGILFRLPAC